MEPKMLHLTAKGLMEYASLSYLQKRMVEILSKEDMTITQLVRQIQMNHHEYRYVEVKVHMSALTVLIKEELVTYHG